MPFRQNWPFHDSDHLGDVVPGHRRVQHLGEISPDRHRAAAHVDVIVQLGQREPFVRDVVQAPRRLDGELHDAARRKPERNGKPGAQIALAISAGDAVDGQHHDVDSSLFRPLEHCAIEAAILVEIKLIHLRRGVFPAQFLEAHRPQRRHAEHRPVLRCCRRDRSFALMVKQALKRGRRTVHGHCKFLAHHGDGEVDAFDAAQHAGHEIAILEARGISAIGHFIVRRPVDVVEDRSWQPAQGELPEVVKAVTVSEAHWRAFVNRPRRCRARCGAAAPRRDRDRARCGGGSRR